MWKETTSYGAIRFVEQYIDPMTGKKKRVSVVMPNASPQNKKLARETLEAKIAAACSDDVYTKKDALNLHELTELYMKDSKKHVAQSTYRRNGYQMQQFEKLLCADTLVAKLSAGYVREKLSDDTNSPTTINERFKRFKMLMHWAYENDYVSDISYLGKLKNIPDPKKRDKLEEKFLEEEELHALLDAMKNERWKNLTMFLALSGLRCGEAIALEIDDIDLKQKMIHVTKTYDVVNYIVTAPKTACSVRDVFMQPELYGLCARLRTEALKGKLRHGYRTNHFFSDRNGDYIGYAAYNKYLKKVSQEVIGYSATTHVMRHTHASLLAASGVPLETITRRLGHENSKITRDVYLHVTEKQLEKDKQLLSAVNIL